jgi:hypothetical protein
MRNLAASVAATFLMAVPTAAQAGDALLVEWADTLRDPEWLPGNPVFQRSLYCASTQSRPVCKLTVITIGRAACPVVLTADSFSTADGDLDVRVAGDKVDIEYRESFSSWMLRLQLAKDHTFVESASGSVTVRPGVPDATVRSTELVPFVSNHCPRCGREWENVDLKCSQVAVVAAKRAK